MPFEQTLEMFPSKSRYKSQEFCILEAGELKSPAFFGPCTAGRINIDWHNYLARGKNLWYNDDAVQVLVIEENFVYPQGNCGFLENSII